MYKTKRRILANLKNTYCRLKPSGIEGVGVFTIKDIPRGINPFRVTRKQIWHKFQVKELGILGKELLSLIDSFFVIEKDATVYIPDSGLSGMDISYFLNNSKKPNVRTIGDGETFVTIRKIKKGEELTVSYATYDEKYK